jgi:hypothetical protein
MWEAKTVHAEADLAVNEALDIKENGCMEGIPGTAVLGLKGMSDDVKRHDALCPSWSRIIGYVGGQMGMPGLEYVGLSNRLLGSMLTPCWSDG